MAGGKNTRFTVNTDRFDPYKNFKFKVKFDKEYVAGVSKISALSRSTHSIEFREGGDPSSMRKTPGQTKYEPITLERGVTHDLEFEIWANTVWNFQGGEGNEVGLKDFRKNITIDVFNEAGQLAISYQVFRCWVSEFKAMADLDAKGNGEILIQSIKLENEGWQRVKEIQEPTEKSIT